jgi:hypothetical protein
MLALQPPAKTLSRAKSACSSAVKREWLQSMVSRSDRCLVT